MVFDGHAVPLEHGKKAAQALGIAVIYQELSLIHGMTVAQNIFLTKEPRFPGLRIIDVKKMNRMAQELIDRYGFQLKATDVIDTLSIGQRQTVEILKALSSKASLMIMDEPTSSLTSTESAQLFEIIRLLKNQGISVLYISHRMEEVYQLSDRVTVLRDGRKVAVLEKEQISPAEIIRLMIGRTLTESESHHRHGPEGGRGGPRSGGPVLPGKAPGHLLPGPPGRDPGFRRPGGLRAHRVDAGHLRHRPLSSAAASPSWGALCAGRGRVHRRGYGFVPEERRLQGIMGGFRSPATSASPTWTPFPAGADWSAGGKELERARPGHLLLNVKPADPDARGGQPLRRQPAEGGRGQVADPRPASC